MGNFMNKAKELVDKYDKQVDKGMDKAGDMADKRTGGKHGEQIDKGVDMAQARTGQGDQGR
ncbi:antitoxin [Micromonospora sp. NPDC126480]|uniref:antitoxin n=1 Tax=Micromonospora sp. NPDC126480 TaxID=3155312 RepID=UPI003320AB4E